MVYKLKIHRHIELQGHPLNHFLIKDLFKFLNKFC